MADEPTGEIGRAGKGEILPTQYGQKVPSLFGEGEELKLLPVGRGMSSEEIEEARKRIKEEKKDEWAGWERAYRAWKLGFTEEGEPRLSAIVHGAVWEPGEGGEVVSDWKEGEDEPFEETSKGLYSLKSLKEIMERYGREDVIGSIIPYGKTYYGSMGYRSEKAKVDALFRNLVPCYICTKPAKYYVHNSERFPLCERCLGRLEKLVKAKGYTEEEVEGVLQRLAEIYEAQIVERPEE